MRRFLEKTRLKDKSFSFLYEKVKQKNIYVSIDTETTGLDQKKDDIISICAMKIVDNTILLSEKFETLLRPKRYISKENIEVHAILPNELDSAVKTKQAIHDLLHFIGNAPLVGYYIDFDVNILNRYVKKYIGSCLVNRRIEVSRLYASRSRVINDADEATALTFDSIVQELDIPRLKKHSARNDALMTAMMFLRLQSMPRTRLF